MKSLFGDRGDNKEQGRIGHLPWDVRHVRTGASGNVSPTAECCRENRPSPFQHNKLLFLFLLLLFLLLFSYKSPGLSSLRCLGELFSLRFQSYCKIKEELRVMQHPGGYTANESEFYYKTGKHEAANLVISCRPSCFGSDEERAVGKGMLRMRRLVGPPICCLRKPGCGWKRKSLSLIFSVDPRKGGIKTKVSSDRKMDPAAKCCTLKWMILLMNCWYLPRTDHQKVLNGPLHPLLKDGFNVIVEK